MSGLRGALVSLSVLVSVIFVSLVDGHLAALAVEAQCEACAVGEA